MKSVVTAFLVLATLCSFIDANNEENCTDFQGQSFAHGLYYVPGPSPNVCSYCVCHHGQPMWCKSIYCRAPYKCRRLENGPRCCDFTCIEEPVEVKTKSAASPTRSRMAMFSTTMIISSIITTLLL